MAGRGKARRGAARLGKAWRGTARSGQQGLCSCFIFNLYKSITNYIVVRHGAARLGLVRRSMFAGGISPALRSIFTNYTQGLAWQGLARYGGARQGKARTAGAKPLLYIQSSQIYHKLYSRPGRAWLGRAWQGTAGRGSGTGLQNPVHYA